MNPHILIEFEMTLAIEKHYQAQMDALSAKERVERAIAMAKWTRDLISRQILSEKGTLSAEQLKWEVALRLYGADTCSRTIIERKLASVSR